MHQQDQRNTGTAVTQQTWAQGLWTQVMRENRHVIGFLSEPPAVSLVHSRSGVTPPPTKPTKTSVRH